MMRYSLQRALLRDMFKGQSLRLLIASLMIATASITAIGVFVERIENTLSNEASSFIAADAKIQGTLPIDQAWQSLANDMALQSAQTWVFSSMLFADASTAEDTQAMQLAQVKAVGDGYPLRGALEVSQNNGNSETAIRTDITPQPGEILLAPRLVKLLQLTPGNTVRLGEAHFVFKGTIAKEPDSVQSAFGMAPRAMIHLDDVAKTQVVQRGSRVRYALLLAGEHKQIDALRVQLKDDLGEHFRWISPEQASAAFGSALARAQRFLLLAGSLSVLLASVAIALSAHQFSLHQQTQVALLKTFGFTPRRIRHLYILLLMIIGLFGCLAGSLLGWSLHHLVVFALHDLLPENLATASTRPFVIGALTSFIALMAFAAPPIVALQHITPAQILRSETTHSVASATSLLLGIAATGALIGLYSQDLPITAVLIGVLFACVAVCGLLAWLLLRVTKRAQHYTHGFWRIGLANLQRNKQFTGLQIFVFASVMLLISVLSELRTSLVDQWRPSLEKTPNYFVFNIFKDELPSIRQRFTDHNVTVSDFYPMSLGRVLTINGSPLKENIQPEKQRTNYERELNLTWSDTLSEDNRIVSGNWWTESPGETMQVSVEESYARGLDLTVGDELAFSVSGNAFTATIANLRKVSWDSMNPNFYMIFDRPFADDFASNWITSFYLPKQQKTFVDDLLRAHPTLSLIELEQTIIAVQSVINQVIRAIEFILGLVLAASILVLLASIQTSMNERRRENALLRSFGAPHRFVQKVVLTEFACIGFLAGIFACVGAEASLYFIQTTIFRFDANIHWMLWLTVPWLTAIGIGMIGYLASLQSINVAPLRILRIQD